MAWRLAKSLAVLRDEVNTVAPGRSKASDGTIGDDAHQGSPSDHNPNGADVVCAIDFTHDPGGGADMHEFAEHIRRTNHPAVKYCLPPDTRVLKADLRWARLSDLRPGATLIGFEEFSDGGDRRGREAGGRLRTSTVEAVDRARLPVAEIETERGTVTASLDHLWLVDLGRGRHWVATRDLAPEMDIVYLADPWAEEAGTDADRLAGLFDGEGRLSCAPDGNGWRLSVPQRSGPVTDEITTLVSSFGAPQTSDLRAEADSVTVTGGLGSLLSVLGRIPSARVRRQAVDEQIWEGRRLGEPSHARVKEVRETGAEEVVMIQTSTRTLIAEGYFSHNCIWNKRIWSKARDDEGWRSYNGSNPHTAHMHVSVGVGPDGQSTGPYDDTSPWGLVDEFGGGDMIGLSVGSSGDRVKGLQATLRYAGFDPGEVDGDYGPKTSAAVLEMRRSEGSEVGDGDNFTGWAYAQLMRALARRY